MIYTDEVRTAGPLAWMLAACFVLWSLALYTWPKPVGWFLGIFFVVVVVIAIIGGRHGKA